MSSPRIRRRIRIIDITKRVEKAAEDNRVGSEGAVAMAVFRENIIQRINANEHIHLVVRGMEECIYPYDRCWEGLREYAPRR